MTLWLFWSACLVWWFFYSTEHCENNSKARLDNETTARRRLLIVRPFRRVDFTLRLSIAFSSVGGGSLTVECSLW